MELMEIKERIERFEEEKQIGISVRKTFHEDYYEDVLIISYHSTGIYYCEDGTIAVKTDGDKYMELVDFVYTMDLTRRIIEILNEIGAKVRLGEIKLFKGDEHQGIKEKILKHQEKILKHQENKKIIKEIEKLEAKLQGE